MISSLLHNDDEFELNPAASGRHSQQVRNDFSRRRIGYQFQWWHVAVAVLVLFPYISIFVLFGLVGNQKSTSNNSYYTTQTISSTSTFGQASLPTTEVGVGLSFTSDGKLQVGAGTTVYKNIASVMASCPAYLSMDAINSQTYLLSYANRNTFNSTMQLVTLNSIDSADVQQVLPVGFYVYEIVTLSETTGIFIAICQDFSLEQQDAYLVAGRVSNGQILLNSHNPLVYNEATDHYSADPEIIALSETSFAIAYYSGRFVATRYGTIDPTSLAMSLSPAVPFANDSTNSTYFTFSPLTSSSYMLFHYTSIYDTKTNTVKEPGLLHALIATVEGNLASAPSTSIVLSNTSILDTAFLSNYFAATTLDNSTVMVVYLDALGNNAVVAQTVRAMTLQYTEIVFGATWIVNGGASYQSLQTGILDIDIQTISTNREFVVLYTDVSNGGAVMATAGQLTDTNELLRSSPDFVLAGASSNLETIFTWGALANGQSSPGNSQTAMLLLQSNGNCDKIAASSFAMLHRLPGPIGVSALLSSSGSSLGVGVSGSVSGLTSLKPGKVYYSNTKGDLIPAANYAGHGQSIALNGLNSQSNLYYVYDAENNAYVTLDSKVGIATAADTLFVQTTTV